MLNLKIEMKTHFKKQNGNKFSIKSSALKSKLIFRTRVKLAIAVKFGMEIKFRIKIKISSCDLN